MQFWSDADMSEGTSVWIHNKGHIFMLKHDVSETQEDVLKTELAR